MGLQATPIFNRCFNGKALLDLAHITEISEIRWKAEITEHRFSNAGIATGILLVAFHHRRGDIQIFVRRGKLLDDVQRGIRLKTKLGTKARIDIAVMLKIFALMPHAPEVHVARAIIMPSITKTERAGRW